LRSALEKYGRHLHTTCNARKQHKIPKCTCGLKEVLKGQTQDAK